MVGYLSETAFVGKLFFDIIMWIVILLITFYCIRRNPTDYDTNYRKRNRMIIGSLCFLAAMGFLFWGFMLPEDFAIRNYFLSTFGTYTPNETMIQLGMSPTISPRAVGVTPIFALPTYEQWLILQKINSFAVTFALGIIFFFFKKSSTRTLAKIRKVCGYIFLIFLVPAALNIHLYFDLEEFIVTIPICIITWLLLRTYRKDFVEPTLPVESVQHRDNKDFAPLTPKLKVTNTMNNEPVYSVRKFNIHKFVNAIKGWFVFVVTKTHLLFSRIKIQRKREGSYKSSFKNKKWKKITKIVLFSTLLISLTIGIILSTIAIFNYYKYDYLPEKRRQDAITQILNEVQSSNEEIKRIRYVQILQNEPEWDVEGLENGSYPYEFLELVDEAFKWFENKAYSGDSLYQMDLASFYDIGNELYRIGQNKVKAAYWYQMAAENGMVQAYAFIGLCYRNGVGVTSNIDKAIYWFRKGADANDPYCLYHLANIYKDGVKVVCGHKYETFRQYDNSYGGNYVLYGEKIARRWDDNKMEWYNIYRKQVDTYKYIIEPDLNRAKELWQKAAAQGHQEAKDKLERIY